MLGAGEALKRLAISDQPSDRSRETRVESREPRAGEKRRTGESAKRRRGDKERGEENGESEKQGNGEAPGTAETVVEGNSTGHQLRAK